MENARLPVVGVQEEAEQSGNRFVRLDVLRGGQPLVQVVEDGCEQKLQARDLQVSGGEDGIEAVLAERLDHIPNVHQVH